METISSQFFIPRQEQGYPDMYKRVRMMPLYSFPHYKDLNPYINFNKNKYFIHLDLDAFYAQAEQRDNPSLRGKPVSVGSTTGNKGIVMTASYEARALGIDTGMSLWEAKKICPQLISVPCYGPKYESILLNIMRGLKSFVPSDLIEQYSIDECFLDISPIVKNFREAENLAVAIKQKILDLENLTCSIGVSYNKTYAKIATKFNKPNGLTVITHGDREKIYKLPVKKLWGVGTRIAKRLSLMNILTIRDLAESCEGALKKEFGINGVVLRKLARGEDTSGIFRKNEKEKCLNHHHTLTNNIYKREDIVLEIRRISEYICRKLRSKKLLAGSLYLVIRYNNLRYSGDHIKLRSATNSDREIFEAALVVYRRFPEPNESLQARMFGITVFELSEDLNRYNLDMFRTTEKKIPYGTLDSIKQKFGEEIIRVGLNSG